MDDIPVTRGQETGGGGLREVEEVLLRAVRERIFPGAVACAGSSAGVRCISGVGRLDYASGRPVSSSTIYDLASLTKVVATTSVVLRLVEQGRLSLTAPVRQLVPGFDGGGRESVTVEHLLTHGSGLPAWRPLFQRARSREEVLALVLAEPLENPPGTVERYSDLGAILLGECAAAAGGPLAALSWQLVFGPLAMRDTCYCPPATARWRIAPTEEDRDYRGRLVHGEVHDENCFAMGGVSGHAGLFSTAEDLGRFAVELLRAVRGGPGAALFGSVEARRFTARRELVSGSSRALGWDTRSDEEDGTGPKGSRSSSGRRFGRGSFGHTGFTGTSMWFDPARDLFAILLSNRVHPGRAGGERMLEVRRAFHDAVAAGSATGPIDRKLLERARADLANAWFSIEDGGRPIGYHRAVVDLPAGGSVVVSDEMVLLSGSGRVSFRSEVTTGPELLDPRVARAETRLGAGQGFPALRGRVEFDGGEMKLSAEILIDGLGIPLSSPRVHRETKRRPAGPLLFQSLVPLLLSSLPPAEDGSSLGEVVLVEFPAEVDRLIGFKPGRRLSISPAEGGKRRVRLEAPGAEPVTSTLSFGTDGGISRIEMERFTERRSTLEEIRRALPGAFP